MKKQVKIVKKGRDDENLKYWLTLSYKERLKNLEKIRQEVIEQKYGTQPGFQRVYRIIKQK